MKMTYNKGMEKYKKLLLDIVYPQNLSCIFCGMPISRNNKYSLCKDCYNKLIFIKNACPKCGKPIINTNLTTDNYIEDCHYCKGKIFLFDRNISFLEYEDLSKRMVFDLKYNSKTFIVNIMAEMMCDVLQASYKNVIEDIDFMTYVPLNNRRLKERGFNQARELAVRLGENVNIGCVDILKRKKYSRKLHGLKSDQRSRELLGAFEFVELHAGMIEGKSIAVVDDIFTTGSTLNEIAKQLKLFGARRVIGLTFLTGKYESI